METTTFEALVNFIEDDSACYLPYTIGTGFFKSTLNENLILISNSHKKYGAILGAGMVFDKRVRTLYIDFNIWFQDFKFLNNTTDVKIVDFPVKEYIIKADKKIAEYINSNYEVLKNKAEPLTEYQIQECRRKAKQEYIKGIGLANYYYNEGQSLYILNAERIILYIANPEEAMQNVLDELTMLYNEVELGTIILKKEIMDETKRSLLEDGHNPYFEAREVYEAIKGHARDILDVTTLDGETYPTKGRNLINLVLTVKPEGYEENVVANIETISHGDYMCVNFREQ